MNKGLAMLNEALRLGALELASLEAGEVEQADSYTAARSKLISEAESFFSMGPAEAFREKLLQMQTLQKKLTDEAKRLQLSLQEQMKKGKMTAMRQRGYNKTLVGSAYVTPQYMNRMG